MASRQFGARYGSNQPDTAAPKPTTANTQPQAYSTTANAGSFNGGFAGGYSASPYATWPAAQTTPLAAANPYGVQSYSNPYSSPYGAQFAAYSSPQPLLTDATPLYFAGYEQGASLGQQQNQQMASKISQLTRAVEGLQKQVQTPAQTTQISCYCGGVAVLIPTGQCYSEGGATCDDCRRSIKSGQVWHCSRGKVASHPYGLDVCRSCAQRAGNNLHSIERRAKEHQLHLQKKEEEAEKEVEVLKAVLALRLLAELAD
eukprot:TRINITY_DN96731_c0_g1_i1.p1 TRINITY_DN96731_c0_g1~~TRINITY_DN96731_c0_g1_i1.p1  ORF type:complete len:258 (-),score=26.23 TRINITY_DN96731_c0_g1_i1:141-914(-)